MKELNIIDNFMDEREFRNYIASFLDKKGFTDIEIEDARISDEDEINNNDLFAKKEGVRYTIQVFLNEEIKKSHIKETKEDMSVENVSNAIIVTNKVVEQNILDMAKNEGIEIWDRNYLMNELD